MSVSVRQAVHQSRNGTGTVAITPLVNPSVLVIFVNGEANNGNTISGVSGNRNGAYTLIASAATSPGYSKTFAYYVKNTTALAETITVTWSGTGNSWTAVVVELDGANLTTTSSMIGTSSTGTNTASGDINTAGNVTGSAGDYILAATGNYYSGTWTVGATNPAGMAAVDSLNAGDGTGNLTVSGAALSGSYAGKVGNHTSASVYGNTVGVQIVAAGGGSTTYNDSIALGAGAHVGDTAAASIAASLALGAGAHIGDSIAATITASLALGAAGGTADGAAATVATSGALGVQAGTSTNAQTVITAAVAAGIAQAFAATNGSVYASTIGLGAAAATGAGATLGLSLSVALAAQYGVSATPAVSAQAIAAFGPALATNPQAALTVASQIGAGIGAGIAAQGGLVFADHIALGAFAQAVAQQVAGVVAIVGRAMLSDAPVFRAVITDSLAGNAIVSDSPVGGATIDEL